MFPYFSQNVANFPNSMGPGPIPKKGCESPDVSLGILVRTPFEHQLDPSGPIASQGRSIWPSVKYLDLKKSFLTLSPLIEFSGSAHG